MKDVNIPNEHLKLLCFMHSLGDAHVEDLLPKGIIKYGLNKLRWVLTDFGISHYYLPEMPIADYIMMAACLDEQTTCGNTLNETVFYRFLAARNILKLLCRAYDCHNDIKKYYDLPIRVVFDVIRNENLFKCPSADVLMHDFSLLPTDSIKIVTDALLARTEPIIDLCDSKSNILQKLIAGTNKEQRILTAYELYHLLFPVFFSLQFPLDYSAEFLNKKYRTQRFKDGHDNDFVNIVRIWRERSVTQ